MSKKDFRAYIDQAAARQAPGRDDGASVGLTRDGVAGTTRLSGAREIPLDRIRPDPDQPRRVFDEATLGELAASIRRHGVLQPILVEYCEDGDYYRIISGERRYRAAGMAELSVIPCLVRVVEEGDRLAQQLVENIQREDLSPVDKARGLLELRARLGAEGTWGHIEALTGLSERRRKQFVALLRLPEDIQRDIVSTGAGRSERQITEKHARALLRLGDYPDEQRRLYDLIRTSEEPISGDRAFELAGEALHGHDGVTRRLVITYRSVSELIEALEERLAALRDVSR